jgi:apolipoprotein D and lipocalin family protein
MSLLHQRLVGATLLAAWLALGVAVASPPVQSVPKVDLARYAGTWYELARFPNRFQDQCAGDVSATYSPNADGSVGVDNRCRRANGEIDRTEGRATPASGDTSGARLKVSFLPSWLQWFPLGRGDYWVVALDPEYRYAVVSEPSREYLWILARTPAMDAPAYDALVDQLRLAGYPVDQLVRTPHSTTPSPAAQRVQRLLWMGAGAARPQRVAL